MNRVKPEEMVKLVHALLPHHELLEAALQDGGKLLCGLLNCAAQNPVTLAQAAAYIRQAPENLRGPASKGIREEFAGRYSSLENAEYFSVLIGSFAETPRPEQSAKKTPSPVTHRVTSLSLTTEAVQERIFALNTCQELIEASGMSTRQLVTAVQSLNLTVDEKRLTGIKSGRYARNLKAKLGDPAVKYHGPGTELINDIAEAIRIIQSEKPAQPEAPDAAWAAERRNA